MAFSLSLVAIVLLVRAAVVHWAACSSGVLSELGGSMSPSKTPAAIASGPRTAVAPMIHCFGPASTSRRNREAACSGFPRRSATAIQTPAVKIGCFEHEDIDVAVRAHGPFDCGSEQESSLYARYVAEGVANDRRRIPRFGDYQAHALPNSGGRDPPVAHQTSLRDALECANADEALEITLDGCTAKFEYALELAQVRRSVGVQHEVTK